MPYPQRVALGATTLARKWAMDVDTNYGISSAALWVGVFGMTEFTPTGAPGLQADSDYDSGGYTSSTATTQEWGVTATLRRGVIGVTPTQYDPGQEYLRLKSKNMGPANSAHIRYYELNGPTGPKVEAYEGICAVAYSNNGGGMDALSTAGLTLTGQGALLPVTHPDSGGVGAPVLGSVAPTQAAVAGGTLVIITGSGFLTATAVTVGGTTVSGPNWEPGSDSVMSLIAPAHAAGLVDIIVTNPGGTSVASAASKITYV
jgi:hypothetical protein